MRSYYLSYPSAMANELLWEGIYQFSHITLSFPAISILTATKNSLTCATCSSPFGQTNIVKPSEVELISDISLKIS